MGLSIKDGTGKSYEGKINSEHQLFVQAEVHELQHHISRDHGQVYQIIGEEVTVAAATQTLLHVKNTSDSLAMAVSYMRMQGVGLAGGTALPSTPNYFQIGFGTTYTSGGSVVTPINVNKKSANIAPATVYDSAPTVGGTFVEADRWYFDTDMMTFNKHGSWILGQNDTMEIRLVSDHTSGIAYCRITVMFVKLNGI